MDHKVEFRTKCERNFSVFWLFLAVATFRLNCLDNTAVRAHPLRALATSTVCFSVLSCWTNRTPSMTSSSVFLHSCRLAVLKGQPSLSQPCKYVCRRFHCQPFLYVVLPFLLPYKADTDVFDYSSFVVNWDISVCTVQMHLHQQQQTQWRIVSKTSRFLISCKSIPSQSCPGSRTHF